MIARGPVPVLGPSLIADQRYELDGAQVFFLSCVVIAGVYGTVTANRRILFAYSTAHIEIKNSHIHYGDLLHSLSGEALNLRATIQPDDPNQPAASWMNTVTFSSTNSSFVYDNRPVNNIDIEGRGRVNQSARPEHQRQTERGQQLQHQRDDLERSARSRG